MQYDCPNCGALEGQRHRASCSLAGLPVWQVYAPFDWAPALAWLKSHLEDFKHNWPGQIVLLNAESLEYKIFYSDAEVFPADPDKQPFGRAPAVGLRLLCQRL